MRRLARHARRALHGLHAAHAGLADHPARSRSRLARAAVIVGDRLGLSCRLPEDEREKVFKELQEIDKKRWPTLLPKIKQSIAQYKRTGYIVNKGSLHAQINAVAVPIMSSDGNVLLSLSAGGISLVFDDETLVKVGNELKRLAVRFASALDAMK